MITPKSAYSNAKSILKPESNAAQSRAPIGSKRMASS